MKQLSLALLFAAVSCAVNASPGKQALSFQDAINLGMDFELISKEKSYFDCSTLKISVPLHSKENPEANVAVFFFHQISRGSDKAILSVPLENVLGNNSHQVEICFQPSEKYRSRFSYYYRGRDWWPGYPDYLVVEDLENIYENLMTNHSSRSQLSGPAE